MRTNDLGAVTDAPAALARVAIARARAAMQRRDHDALRDAAELGYRAASRAADRAAARLGIDAPCCADQRREALRALDVAAELHTGALVSQFDVARDRLHGRCFHAAQCSPLPALALALASALDGARVLADQAEPAMRRVGRLR